MGRLKRIGVRELARRARVDKGYMSRVLAGKRAPSLRVVRRMAKAIGMSLGRLIEELPRTA